MWDPIPLLNLNLVLTQLMLPPFEHIVNSPLFYLSVKRAFIIASPSARRICEIHIFVMDPYSSMLLFYKDKMFHRPHPKYLPEVEFSSFCGILLFKTSMI